jgi:hypothetical protein
MTAKIRVWTWAQPNMRLSGRAVNKVPGLLLRVMAAMTRCRAAQLWR